MDDLTYKYPYFPFEWPFIKNYNLQVIWINKYKIYVPPQNWCQAFCVNSVKYWSSFTINLVLILSLLLNPLPNNLEFWQPLIRHLFNLFPNKLWFLPVCSTSLLKTLREKEKLFVTSNFSFSSSVFYSFGALSAIFINFEIVVCKLFQFGRV